MTLEVRHADGSFVRSPEILSARYDAATNRTIITGTRDTRLPTNPSFVANLTEVSVYANDAPDESGFGEGQYFLGNAVIDASPNWTFTWTGRLPGPWVSATVTKVLVPRALSLGPAQHIPTGTTTSEFSRTVRVEE